MVSDRGSRAQRPAKGGFHQLIEDAASGLSIRLGAPVQRIAWSGTGVSAILQNGERIEADRALITVPVGLLRAGLPRSIPLPPEDQRTAIGRLGYGRGCWARSTCASRGASGPSGPNGSVDCLIRPERRGTFNTVGQP